jgi:hypothetical protein
MKYIVFGLQFYTLRSLRHTWWCGCAVVQYGAPEPPRYLRLTACGPCGMYANIVAVVVNMSLSYVLNRLPFAPHDNHVNAVLNEVTT